MDLDIDKPEEGASGSSDSGSTVDPALTVSPSSLQVTPTVAIVDPSEDGEEQPLRRVKVYELINGVWLDRGTGFCQGYYDTAASGAFIYIRSEDNGETLLQTQISSLPDVYQRQQSTLIVWCESDGTDIALSFQEEEGCTQVWEFLTEVRRHDSVPTSPPSPSSFPGLGLKLKIPMPELGNLEEVDHTLREGLRREGGREFLSDFVLHNDFISALAKVHSDAEDMEALDDLHRVCTIMQMILMLNDNVIFEYVLQDTVFTEVIGMLEYDPEFPTLKASYRDEINTSSSFREVVPLRNPEVKVKIQHTYRLLYLKDVVLARTLDDPAFNILNSLVFFNQIDIMNHLQNDEAFLIELFGLFEFDVYGAVSSQTVDASRQHDALAFLRDLCAMGKNVQLAARQTLYRALCKFGLLNVCKWAVAHSNPTQFNTGIEIIMTLTDNDPNSVRTFVLKEYDEECTSKNSKSRSTLLKVMCDLLDGDKRDVGFKSQIAETLRSLLDTPAGNDTEAKKWSGNGQLKTINGVAEKFLQYFYDDCINSLFKPLLDLEDGNDDSDKPETSAAACKPSALKLSREQSTIASHLCDLISFFVTHHSYRIQYYILSSPISWKIALLLKVSAALRYFRSCVGLNNNYMTRHLIKQNLFLPVLQLACIEGVKDNLVSSACLEFFDCVRKLDSNKFLLAHLFEKHQKLINRLRDLETVGCCFHQLATKYNQQREPIPLEIKSEIPLKVRTRSVMESTQDDYFNESDEDDMESPVSLSPTEAQNLEASHQSRRKRPRVIRTTGSLAELATNGSSQGLVDYNDDDPDPDPGPDSAVSESSGFHGFSTNDEDRQNIADSQLPESLAIRFKGRSLRKNDTSNSLQPHLPVHNDSPDSISPTDPSSSSNYSMSSASPSPQTSSFTFTRAAPASNGGMISSNEKSPEEKSASNMSASLSIFNDSALPSPGKLKSANLHDDDDLVVKPISQGNMLKRTTSGILKKLSFSLKPAALSLQNSQQEAGEPPTRLPLTPAATSSPVGAAEGSPTKEA